jgi:hypothetical protein
VANLALRWAHVIVGIAWIGASLYFIWLDNHLEPSGDPRIAGELWAIHGGGFYRAEKFRLARRACRRRCTGSSGRRTGPGSPAWRCSAWCITRKPSSTSSIRR